MTVKIAINGFGRIGRAVLRGIFERPYEDVEVVTINDLMDVETLAYLLKYDSAHGRFSGTVEAKDNFLVVDGKPIEVTKHRDPADLPYSEKGVEIALECTGLFRTRDKASRLLDAGAKRVIISAPAKDEVDATIVLGVNDHIFDPDEHFVLSNASCTTNCLAPLVKVVDDAFGVKRGMMTTIHAYTNDQKLHDQPHKDPRRGRAAAMSMVPTTTGAAKAVGLVLPHLHGKLSGMAVRVPTINVSLVDLVVELEKDVTREEVNEALIAAATGPMKGILAVTDEPLVSVDLMGNPNSSIADLSLTEVTSGNMVKLISWYDNEWAYSMRLVELATKIAG